MTWGQAVLLGQQQPWLGMEHIKGTWILLIALGTLIRELSHEPLGMPSSCPSNWPMDTSSSMHLTQTHPHLPVYALEGMNGVSLCA